MGIGKSCQFERDGRLEGLEMTAVGHGLLLVNADCRQCRRGGLRL